MNLSGLMRIAAVVCFILMIPGWPWPSMTELAVGLTLWCASTLVPPSVMT